MNSSSVRIQFPLDHDDDDSDTESHLFMTTTSTEEDSSLLNSHAIMDNTRNIQDHNQFIHVPSAFTGHQGGKVRRWSAVGKSLSDTRMNTMTNHDTIKKDGNQYRVVSMADSIHVVPTDKEAAAADKEQPTAKKDMKTDRPLPPEPRKSSLKRTDIQKYMGMASVRAESDKKGSRRKSIPSWSKQMESSSLVALRDHDHQNTKNNGELIPDRQSKNLAHSMNILTPLEMNQLQQETNHLKQTILDIETHLQIERKIQAGAQGLMRAYSQDSKHNWMASVQLIQALRKENTLLREVVTVSARAQDCHHTKMRHNLALLHHDLLTVQDENAQLRAQQKRMNKKWKAYQRYSTLKYQTVGAGGGAMLPVDAWEGLAEARVQVVELTADRERLLEKCQALSEALEYWKRAYRGKEEQAQVMSGNTDDHVEKKNLEGNERRLTIRTGTGVTPSTTGPWTPVTTPTPDSDSNNSTSIDPSPIQNENMALRRELDAVKASFDVLARQQSIMAYQTKNAADTSLMLSMDREDEDKEGDENELVPVEPDLFQFVEREDAEMLAGVSYVDPDGFHDQTTQTEEASPVMMVEKQVNTQEEDKGEETLADVNQQLQKCLQKLEQEQVNHVRSRAVFETVDKEQKSRIHRLETLLKKTSEEALFSTEEVSSLRKHMSDIEAIVITKDMRADEQVDYDMIVSRVLELKERHDSSQNAADMSQNEVAHLKTLLEERQEEVAKLSKLIEEMRVKHWEESDAIIAQFQNDFEEITQENDKKEEDLVQMRAALDVLRSDYQQKLSDMRAQIARVLDKWLSVADKLYFKNEDTTANLRAMLINNYEQDSAGHVLEDFLGQLFNSLDQLLTTKSTEHAALIRQLEAKKQKDQELIADAEASYRKRIEEIERTLSDTIAELESTHHDKLEILQQSYNKQLEKARSEEQAKHQELLENIESLKTVHFEELKKGNELVASTEKELRELTQAHNALKNETTITIKDLEGQVKVIETELASVREERDKLQAELVTMKELNPPSPTSRKTFKTDIETLQQRWTDLQKVHEEKMIELEQSAGIIDALKRALADKETIRVQMAEEKEQLVHTHDELKQRFAAEQNRLQDELLAEKQKSDALEATLKTIELSMNS